MLRVTVLLAALWAGSWALTACDPAQGVTFVNETEREVEVYSDGQLAGRLNPGQSRTFSYLEYVGEKVFEFRDKSGTVILSERLTWDELAERDWKIVVSVDSGFVVTVPDVFERAPHHILR